MYKKICITNRKLVEGSLEERIERICSSDVDLIILREKDLEEAEYEKLASRVLNLCKAHHKDCILHSFIHAAHNLGQHAVHLSFPAFLALSEEEREYFTRIGVSTHSVEEAVLCEQMGAAYITASHIFETQCKPGLSPRGLSYLEEVCRNVHLPVYALGGIHPDNMESCVEKGAAGVCMMSEYMRGSMV